MRCSETSMRDMYKVYYAKEFKRSWKRLAHSGKFKEEEFRAILLTLCSVDALPLTCRDHAPVATSVIYAEIYCVSIEKIRTILCFLLLT